MSAITSMEPSGLSSPRRIALFAVLLPCAIAVSDQFFMQRIVSDARSGTWFYPWMVFTTAILSWSVGRYLSPALLRWLVLVWALALLDFLTIAACMSGRVAPHFGYVLVAAQICLLTLWAALADVPWQWRLPAGLVAMAAIIVFSGSFMSWWDAQAWNALMVLTAALVTAIFFILHFRGFRLRTQTSSEVQTAPGSGLRQFGTKHMLIWASAIVPLLLIVRGVNLSWLEVLATGDVFSALPLAASLAILDLLAIRATLGRGNHRWPLVLLFCATPALAFVLREYARYSQPSRLLSFRTPFDYFLFEMRDDWIIWFVLNTAMLVALLLFLRAQGYRLVRCRSAELQQ